MRSGSVPVSTNVRPASGPRPAAAPSASNCRPWARRSAISVAHLLVRELAVDELGHDRADARRRGDLLGRRGQQRVDRAELLGEVAAGDVADALDPDREQHAAERPLARRLDRVHEALGARPRRSPRAPAAARASAGRSRRGAHEAGALELQDRAPRPRPVDVHRPARGEVLEQLPTAVGAAAAVRAPGEDTRPGS